MKGDFTRETFSPLKQYSGVRMQQGRVQLDADWNEQVDIISHRIRREARDVIGPVGAPKNGGGFAIGVTPDGVDLTISPGRIYVDGILVEWNPTAVRATRVGTVLTLASLTVDGQPYAAGEWVQLLQNGVVVHVTTINAVDPATSTLTIASPPMVAGVVWVRRLATYLHQPFLPNPPQPANDGDYLAYLDVWERHVTALEDPDIREIALGGPDTATRTQIVWQVKLLRLDTPAGTVTCDTVPLNWPARVLQRSGSLTARTQPAAEGDDPCLTPAGGGYRGLENQLYRVEIHRVNADGSATFKWSRDNGSIVTAWIDRTNNNLKVSSLGRDGVLGFFGQTWVELTDDTHELLQRPGTILRATQSASEDSMLTLDPATVHPGDSILLADFPVNRKLRRWESDERLVNGAYQPLEFGLEVRFEQSATYRVGDYWLIPARSAVGDSGGDILWPLDIADPNNPQPKPQRPLGVIHRVCALAALPVGGAPMDCRPDFPSLTEICAEDVCFDNNSCAIPDAKTVQDVLNYLCRETDLRFHNKHLHGWGIVCGLQVVCADDPQSVIVRSGYAIDCEGYDLRLRDERRLNIPELLQASGIDPAGEKTEHYYLVFEMSANGDRFRLEAPGRKRGNPLQEIFGETLLFQFLQDCVLPLVVVVRGALLDDDAETETLVTPPEQRLISLLNLFVQLFQSQYGRNVYLSRKEHALLAALFERLIGVLGDEPFACRLADTLLPIPDYPFDEIPPGTIFGRGNHRRIRIHPSGGTAYTAGADNRIHQYDLTTGRLAAVIEFPAGGTLVVQDMVFSEDGASLFAIATSESASYIAEAAINGTEHTWGEISTFANVRLVTIDTFWSRPAGWAYRGEYASFVAIGKGTGIYALNRGYQDQFFTIDNLYPCNAVGHLQTSRDPLFTAGSKDRALPFMVATVNQDGVGGEDTYDSLLFYRTAPDIEFDLRRIDDFTGAASTGRDDILLVGDSQRGSAALVVAIDIFQSAFNTAVGSMILGFDGTSPSTRSVVDLEADGSPVTFAYNAAVGHAAVAYENSFQLRLLDLETDTLDQAQFHPAQISPVSMVYHAEPDRLYVLNAVSNTITVIDAATFVPIDAAAGETPQFDAATFFQYRGAMREAYFSLAAALIQHVKDCFCDHLLVNCPECDEDDKVYLGEITMRNGEVFKVCNFSKRQYVKTFPTVSYWMSLFPVEAVLDFVVEELCCLFVPDMFGRRRKGWDYAGRPMRTDVAEDVREYERTNVSFANIRGATMRGGLTALRRAGSLGGLGAVIQTALGGTTLIPNLVRDSLGDLYTRLARPEMPLVALDKRPGAAVIGHRADDVKTQLEANDIAVVVQPYEPAAGLENLRKFISSSGSIAAGSRVTLYEAGGSVRYYTVDEPARVQPPQTAESPPRRTKAATAEAAAVPESADDLRSEVNRLREALTERDGRISELFEAMHAMRGDIAALQPAGSLKPAKRTGKSRSTK